MTAAQRMLIAVRSITELVQVLAYQSGSWWSVTRDLEAMDRGVDLFSGRAYWHDLLGRPHVRMLPPSATMELAAEALEWELRRDVAHMHDFEDPRVRA